MPDLLGIQKPNMNWQQGPSLLTGYAPPQNSMIPPIQPPQNGLLASMGPWSQMAYNMAGRPMQGPYPNIPGPTALPGSLVSNSAGGGGSAGGAAGSLVGGLLGAVAKNPALLKSAVGGIQGLLGGGTAASAGTAASSTAATLAGMPVDSIAGAGGLLGADGALTGATVAPIGVDAVSTLPSVAGAIDAGATTGATGGALGGGASADAAGLSAGAGAASALGIFAIPALLASTVKQHDRDASQYAGMLKDLNSGPSASGWNASTQEIIADIANGRTQEYPQAVLEKARQLGLYASADALRNAGKTPVHQGTSPTKVSGNRQ